MLLDHSLKHTNLPFCIAGFFFFFQKTTYINENLWKYNENFMSLEATLPLKCDYKAENGFILKNSKLFTLTKILTEQLFKYPNKK